MTTAIVVVLALVGFVCSLATLRDDGRPWIAYCFMCATIHVSLIVSWLTWIPPLLTP